MEYGRIWYSRLWRCLLYCCCCCCGWWRMRIVLQLVYCFGCAFHHFRPEGCMYHSLGKGDIFTLQSWQIILRDPSDISRGVHHYDFISSEKEKRISQLAYVSVARDGCYYYFVVAGESTCSYISPINKYHNEEENYFVTMHPFVHRVSFYTLFPLTVTDRGRGWAPRWRQTAQRSKLNANGTWRRVESGRSQLVSSINQ